MVRRFTTALNYSIQNLQISLDRYLKDKNYRLNQAIQGLDHLSPLKILSRGYAVVEMNDKVVRSVKDVKKNESVRIQLNDGKIDATVENIHENKE